MDHVDSVMDHSFCLGSFVYCVSSMYITFSWTCIYNVANRLLRVFNINYTMYNIFSKCILYVGVTLRFFYFAREFMAYSTFEISSFSTFISFIYLIE